MNATATARRMSAAQWRVLLNLERTAFYGQNQRTFGALLNMGLIEFAPTHEHPQVNRYQRTGFGLEVLRKLER